MKLIIDTDPGVDDALAILYAALHPGIQLVGLTTVFGNVTVEQATRNALCLVERAGLDVPVAEGAGKPLELPPFEPAAIVHGPEGFGDIPAPVVSGKALEETAAEFLVRMARETPGEIVLCPIGPITNVAEAIRLDPDFATNIKSIVFMGGALDARGNVSGVAEANTWHDPHALDIVLASGADITMVGLDVTMQVLLTAEDFRELARIDPEHGAFLQEMSHFYLAFYHSKGEAGCGFHDPMAVMACLMPDLLDCEVTPLSVVLEGEEIGRTVRATGPAAGRAPVRVALGCDPAEVKRRYFDLFASVQAAG
ncbi:nucleoside hydrolase [Pseudooceanicola sp. HF7]|uniref:nucleoside hydrolase n=1 Tax=Pseudooceanicola sp. HF7 TaxID=2721560 RepID=UPI00143035D3|nr:nucleoside hydrolase [Pseudooceanicola sp. HF7]NIZ10880.1 nucleoside hydrolase [Pseudooceanicola sp. HF7]